MSPANQSWSSETGCSRNSAGTTWTRIYALTRQTGEPHQRDSQLPSANSTKWMPTECEFSLLPASRTSKAATSRETTRTWKQPCAGPLRATTLPGSLEHRRPFACSWPRSSRSTLLTTTEFRPAILQTWQRIWCYRCSTTARFVHYGTCYPSPPRGSCSAGFSSISLCYDVQKAKQQDWWMRRWNPQSGHNHQAPQAYSDFMPSRWMMHTRRFRNPQAPLAYADNLLLLARISNASLRNLLAPLDSPGSAEEPSRHRTWRRWWFRYSMARKRRPRYRRRHQGFTDLLRCISDRLYRVVQHYTVQNLYSSMQRAAGIRDAFCQGCSDRPNSGGKEGHSKTPHANFLADAKVGSSLGRRLPEAIHRFPHSPADANHHDHFFEYADSQGMALDLDPNHSPHRCTLSPRGASRPLTTAGGAHPSLRASIRGMLLCVLQFQASGAAIASLEPTGTAASFPPKPPQSRIAKRSYQRALRRAQKDGQAWYRGRLLQAPRPCPTPRHHQTSSHDPQPERTHQPDKSMNHAMQILSWNQVRGTVAVVRSPDFRADRCLYTGDTLVYRQRV